MTVQFDYKLLNQARWVHYIGAVLVSLTVLYIRILLTPVLGDKTPYGLAILPVAVVAYAGGFGPGIVSGLVGLLGSIYLFVVPRNSFLIPDRYDQFQLFISISICLFISAIAGRLRTSALKNHRLAQQLEFEQRQNQDVLSSITDAYYVVDKDWQVVQTNRAFDRLLADRGSAAPGQSLWQAFPARDAAKVYEALNVAMMERRPQTLEVEDDRGQRWYQVQAYPTALGVSVFLHDVTERRHFEQSRDRMLADERRARSAAEEASRMKEEFLATLSHELRTPMTSLLGWAHLLNRGNVPADRLQEGLASIEQSAQTQAKMVEELLDVSRINAGKLKVEMEFLGLAHLVEEAVAIHRPAAVAKRIEVVFQDESQDAIVRGDAARMHQVLSNLISNAIKFSAKGGHVFIRAFVQQSSACCTVVDDGEGIAPEFLPHVFDRFRQANSTASRQYSGLGIGLSIAKQLVELQGGTITAASEGIGHGSVFTLCLPVAPVNDRISFTNKQSDPQSDLEGVRVLVVEDDSSTRLLLTRMIEAERGHVYAASDAAEALEAIASFRPTVVLSDVGLPSMDGYAMMRIIRSRTDAFQGIPAIALTAFARDSDRREARDAGFTAFHTKPVNASALLKTIAELNQSA